MSGGEGEFRGCDSDDASWDLRLPRVYSGFRVLTRARAFGAEGSWVVVACTAL